MQVRASHHANAARDSATGFAEPGPPGKQTRAQLAASSPGTKPLASSKAGESPATGEPAQRMEDWQPEALLGAMGLDHPLEPQSEPTSPTTPDASEASAAADAGGHEDLVAATLHRPRQQFQDTRGAQHTLFIRGSGSATELVMASRVANLKGMLQARHTVASSPAQRDLLTRALELVRKIEKLIDIANALSRGKLTKTDLELPESFAQYLKEREIGLESELPHRMGVEGDVPEGHPLAKHQKTVPIGEMLTRALQILSGESPKRGRSASQVMQRTKRLQLDALMGRIHEDLGSMYARLATFLEKVDPPLSNPEESSTSEPLSEEAKDRHYRCHLLPRPQFEYVSTAGSGVGIKPRLVRAVGLSANHAVGTEPQESEQVTGWNILKAFELTAGGSSWVRMHLVSQKLGGLGIPENLVPGPSALNLQMERQFEHTLKQLAGYRQRHQDNVVFVQVEVTYHPKEGFDERTRAFLKNRPFDSDDFAQKIVMRAGHCGWNGAAWEADDQTAQAAPDVLLPLPSLIPLIGDGSLEPRAERIAKLQAQLKEPLQEEPTQWKERVEQIEELLSLPLVSGHQVSREALSNDADKIFAKLLSRATELDGQREEARKTNNAAALPTGRARGLTVTPSEDMEQMTTEACELRAFVDEHQRAMGKRSDPYELGERPLFRTAGPARPPDGGAAREPRISARPPGTRDDRSLPSTSERTPRQREEEPQELSGAKRGREAPQDRSAVTSSSPDALGWAGDYEGMKTLLRGGGLSAPAALQAIASFSEGFYAAHPRGATPELMHRLFSIAVDRRRVAPPPGRDPKRARHELEDRGSSSERPSTSG